MRIQHNIMAMSAYRNYTNNVSAMKKNLEKLSSGYKINRAGDDAAGLAISEKMRAQITGLETAQKNAKDGISLVQTAEGALTEVHDMLNRMVELATMSANGTYDNETDRAQLQKEMDQLNSEINRIADSANFNGIKLLNGNMQDGFDTKTTLDKAVADAQAALEAAKATAANPPTTVTETTELDTAGIKNLLKPEMDATDDPQAVAGTKTILESTAGGGGKPKFSVELDGLAHQINNADHDLTLTVGGQAVTDAAGAAITIPGNMGTELDAADLAVLYDGAKVSIDGVDYTAKVETDSTRITFTADDDPAAGTVVNAHYDVAFTPDGPADAAEQNGTVGTYTIDLSGSDAAGSYNTAKIDGVTVTHNTDGATTAADFVKAYNADVTKAYTASTDANGVITLTQKVAGAVADAPVVEGIIADGADAIAAEVGVAGEDPASAATGGTAGMAAKYEFDLTDGVENGIDGKKIDDVTITWNTDLATTLSDFVADYNATAGKDYVASVNGNKIVLTARQQGAVDAANVPACDITDLKDAAGTGAGDAVAVSATEATKGADAMDPAAAGTTGTINVGTVDININTVATEDRLANTVVNLSGKFTDGAEIKLGNTTYTIKVGADSKVADDAENVVDLSAYTGNEADFDAIAASALTVAAKDNDVFSVGQGATAGSITLQQLTSAKDDTDMETMDKLAGYIGVKSTTTRNMTDAEKAAATEAANKAVTDAEKALADAQKAAEKAVVGKSLTLQIGDTAEDFNQLKVDIKDMHAVSLGQEYDEDGNVIDADNLATIRIDDQTKAANAIDVIKRAINQVSDVRGTLGATQNRLDHTINNLSVMTENIQDAESTIRDVDVAEEMMAYTKNNILIQSAQAMLAQANQVPQGVLQLLQ